MAHSSGLQRNKGDKSARTLANLKDVAENEQESDLHSP